MNVKEKYNETSDLQNVGFFLYLCIFLSVYSLHVWGCLYGYGNSNNRFEMTGEMAPQQFIGSDSILMSLELLRLSFAPTWWAHISPEANIYVPWCETLTIEHAFKLRICSLWFDLIQII